MNMPEQSLPYNLQAERGVLGSILIDPEAMASVFDLVRPDDFYRDAHRTIYQAMCRLYEQRTPADSITLCDALERAKKLDEVGGHVGIFSLSNDLPTSSHAEHYARIVANAALCRRYIHAAGQIAALAYSQDPAVAEKVESLIYGLEQQRTPQSGFSKLSSVLVEYMTDLDTLHEHKGSIIGVPTGFRDMDTLFGGLQKTDLVILAGRPGTGKTSLATNIARNAAETDRTVAVFSLEMGNKQLAGRLMAMESRIDMQRLRMGWVHDAEWDGVVGACDRLSSLPIYLNDAAANPISTMRKQLRRLKQDTEHLDLIVVDYLQLIGPGDDHDPKRRENRVQEISDISQGLKAIAKDFNVPVLALAQLSRAVEQRQNKLPVLSDLRESGSIENDADIVMFVYRDDYYAHLEKRESKSPGMADIIVAKHRNGPVGDVVLRFDASLTRFSDLDAPIGVDD